VALSDDVQQTMRLKLLNSSPMAVAAMMAMVLMLGMILLVG
jgi:hypothetical protein